MLALNQLAAHLVRNAQNLSTAKIRTDQLYSHDVRSLSTKCIIDRYGASLEPDGRVIADSA